MAKPLQRSALLAFKTKQQDGECTPLPSATRGLLFFNHVMFAAGLASCATHVPSCGTKEKKNNTLRKFEQKRAFKDQIIEKKTSRIRNTF